MTAGTVDPPAACDCGNPALIVLLDEQGREVPVCEACLDQGIRQAIEEHRS